MAKVAREVVEKAGINVKQLLDKLVKAAGRSSPPIITTQSCG
jgi:ferritin-like protein